jgi:DNA-binding response OmpR family regulator
MTTDTPSKLIGKSFLLIEDDPLLAEAMQRFIQDHGGKVALKGSVRGPDHGALPVFRSEEFAFDLVILDVKLPDTDEKLSAANETAREFGEWHNKLRIAIDTGHEGDEVSVRERLEQLRDEYNLMLNPRAALEILKEVREDEPMRSRLARRPIMLLTSLNDTDTRNRAIELCRDIGCKCKYLIKPVDENAILAAIESLVG